MRDVEHQIPAPIRILQLATASWMSAAVSAMAALGVADELSSGPRPLAEVAEALDAHAPTLHRLLRTCADLDLVDELDGQVFRLTELGQALRSDVPDSMRGFAAWVGEPADRHTWSNLPEAVRSGRSQFTAVHGVPVWEYMGSHPAVATVFDQAMTEVSAQINPSVLASYDFRPFGTIVDVGGGHGALLAAVLQAAPQARGVLCDTPDVRAGATKLLADAGVGGRSEVVGGNFFAAVPPGGDLYLLSNVIHNWDDDGATKILRNCADAMAESGRVLLVETVMPAKAEPALPVRLMDLNMLLLCDGRQRTPDEFEELFQRAGLELSRVIDGDCSLVEAVRR